MPSGRHLKMAKFLVPFICAYLAIQFVVCISEGEQGETETAIQTQRKPKNLFPFVWVTFQPGPCGANNDGVCVQRGKCTKRGGTTNGNCQDGFGECCMFAAECDANHTTIDVNNLVTTLNDPTPVDTQCTFRFRKEPNICQIRLDFETFDFASADEDGMCLIDRLLIKNSITIPNDFTTCGNLNQQHMYLTFGTQESIEVTPMIKRATSRYKIVATRIPCDSKNKAPDFCLQYFTKPSDRVKSFDFGGQQQDSQMYTVCVKPMSASTKIQWKPCTGITGAAIDIADNADAAIPLPCNADWIQVKGLPKVCEPFLEQTSAWKPYELLVNFDETEFPPLPPIFNMPAIDPATCDANCHGIPGVYDCGCIGTAPNKQCQCIVLAVQDPGNPGTIPQTDFNNTGFCLDYTQL